MNVLFENGISEVQNVLWYWLKSGVDGFRFDVINFLTTDIITADNPMKNDVQEHLTDINQSGIKKALKKIKLVVNEYDNRFVVVEIGSDKIEVLKQYQALELLDVVFNFNFGTFKNLFCKVIF